MGLDIFEAEEKREVRVLEQALEGLGNLLGPRLVLAVDEGNLGPGWAVAASRTPWPYVSKAQASFWAVLMPGMFSPVVRPMPARSGYVRNICFTLLRK